MSLILVTAPAALVTLEDAKAHLDVEHTDDDDLITAQTAAATRLAEQYTGRAFMPQVWEQREANFPWTCDPRLHIERRPLMAVQSVTYIDQDGVQQTWDDAGYVVYGIGSERGGTILPAPAGYWPATRCQPEAVVVRFQAGYASVSHPDLDLARAAVKLILGDLYANRDGQIIDTRAAAVPNKTVDALLDPLRVID